AGLLRQRQGHAHGAGKIVAKNVYRVNKRVIDIDALALQRLASRESLELGGQFDSALGGLNNLSEHLRRHAALLNMLPDKRKIAGNRREDIVQLVGNCTRELHQGLHFFGIRHIREGNLSAMTGRGHDQWCEIECVRMRMIYLAAKIDST